MDEVMVVPRAVFGASAHAGAARTRGLLIENYFPLTSIESELGRALLVTVTRFDWTLSATKVACRVSAFS